MQCIVSNLFSSGLFAGLSMLFIRSNAMSLYVFVKALEVCTIQPSPAIIIFILNVVQLLPHKYTHRERVVFLSIALIIVLLSLLCLALFLKVLYFRGVRAGWLWSHYYGDVVIYSISTAVLFHAVKE